MSRVRSSVCPKQTHRKDRVEKRVMRVAERDRGSATYLLFREDDRNQLFWFLSEWRTASLKETVFLNKMNVQV